jgi:hypothetical protein
MVIYEISINYSLFGADDRSKSLIMMITSHNLLLSLAHSSAHYRPLSGILVARLEAQQKANHPE